ncbi:MAG TPA: methyltransferase domain-containing protein [Alphaproteobacteria bacterium]|nr:methyltransferase domain-containing protein [Alphaproteobacteria bacterium]
MAHGAAGRHSPEPRTPEAQAICERFAREYALARAPAMREIERAVFGCDYGGTSWTTRQEADEVAHRLDLKSESHLLEIGAGSGWPGLYFARLTGCQVTLTDLPFEAMRIAAERIAVDGLKRVCRVLASDAAAMPFSAGGFDAISHSDVLCCLAAKSLVLTECRRVIRRGGTMAFSVISIASGLSPRDHLRAADAGPPFKAVSSDYPALLAEAGWSIDGHVDLTEPYARAIRRIIAEELARASALGELLGSAAFAERMERRARTIQAVDAGLLRRELFVATAAD